MAGTKNSGGRNKLSAAAHVLRGTFRADRHADDATPQPPLGVPKPPKPLSGDAKAEWNRMVLRLSTNQTLSIVDDGALYQYCDLFAETEDLKASYWRLRKTSGQMLKAIKGLEGGDLVNALAEVAKLEHEIGRTTVKLRQNHIAMKAWLVEFGLTPSSRTRVKQLAAGAQAPQSRVESFRQRKVGA